MRSDRPMLSARKRSSSCVGIGRISSKTVRNRPPVNSRSARRSSMATGDGLAAVALILNCRLQPAGLQAVEIIAMRAVNDREDLRDGLVELGRNRVAYLAHCEEQAGDGLVFDRRHAVLGGERLDALRETILA